MILHHYSATSADFGGLMALASASEQPVLRLTFFGEASLFSPQLLTNLEQAASQYFSPIPLIAFVAEEPLEGYLLLECVIAEPSSQVTRVKGGWLIHSDHSDELWLGGLSGDATTIFEQMEAAISSNGFAIHQLVRQWNYIPHITGISAGVQNYQAFNDNRSRFYAKDRWLSGYPAATGIGTAGGVLAVDAVLCRALSPYCRIVAIDNPLQVAAHNYTGEVLYGADAKKTTPKFERAKAVVKGSDGMVYISGTAAIRSQESMTGVGAEKQTHITMQNIEALVSSENLAASGISGAGEVHFLYLRVYVKQKENFSIIKQYMTVNYPSVPTVYLWADVCREELLVEIEGLAEFTVSV